MRKRMQRQGLEMFTDRVYHQCPDGLAIRSHKKELCRRI